MLVDVPSPQVDHQSIPTFDVSPPPLNNDFVNDLLIGKDKKPAGSDAKIEQVSLSVGLACEIATGDLLLANLGDAIVSGAKVKWQAAGAKGTVALPNGLRAGQKARIEMSSPSSAASAARR